MVDAAAPNGKANTDRFLRNDLIQMDLEPRFEGV